MKLNVGSGDDHRIGYVNIDGNSFKKPDIILNIKPGVLLSNFGDNSCEEILAKDILEHFTHWEAKALLKEFYKLLEVGGTVLIITPDFEIIVGSDSTAKTKQIWIYGGQDYLDKDTANRAFHPEYYCHKYCWIEEELIDELKRIGFSEVEIIRPKQFNIILKAKK